MVRIKRQYKACRLKGKIKSDLCNGVGKEQWKQVNKYHIIGKRTRGEILRMEEELAGA